MKKPKKPLSRIQSAHAILDAYDDLESSEIRRLPKAERTLYRAALDFIESIEVAKHVHKPAPSKRAKRPDIPRRTPRPVSHVPSKPKKLPRKPTKPKTRLRSTSKDIHRIPKVARKTKIWKQTLAEKRLLSKFPELDVMDDLEEILEEEIEVEWYAKP